MNIKTLKNIMKEVNEPNEFIMTPYDLVHPLYWIWKVENCRLKTLDSRLSKKRKEQNIGLQEKILRPTSIARRSGH